MQLRLVFVAHAYLAWENVNEFTYENMFLLVRKRRSHLSAFIRCLSKNTYSDLQICTACDDQVHIIRNLCLKIHLASI